MGWMREALIAEHHGELRSPPRVHTYLGGGRLVFTTGALDGEWFGYRSYDSFDVEPGERPLFGADPAGLTVSLVEGVVAMAGEDVHVQMPDVLVAGRFVVLSGRHTLAGVGGAHRDRDLLDQVPHRMPDVGWHRVEVLVVLPGDH